MSDLSGHKSLEGKTIICTYPIKPEDDFLKTIIPFKVNVVEMPLIEIVPINFLLPKQLELFDWLIFTSKNALVFFFSKFSSVKNKIAVIGKSTAEELIELGYTPDFIGSGKSGNHFLEELKEVILPGRKILLLLGKLAPDMLEDGLSLMCDVNRVNVYETRKPDITNDTALKMILDNNYDVIVVTSPSAVHNLFLLLNGYVPALRFISIGEVTSAAIRDYGIEPVATSKNQSYKGLAETVVVFLSGL